MEAAFPGPITVRGTNPGTLRGGFSKATAPIAPLTLGDRHGEPQAEGRDPRDSVLGTFCTLHPEDLKALVTLSDTVQPRRKSHFTDGYN